MPSPTETVTRFLARWAVPGDLDQAFRDAFTPSTVWENVGMATTTGVDEALALNRSFEQQLGMATIKVDVLAAAADGNRVLTERVDHLLDGDGKVIMSARCMGVFEVEQGKITAWRDFFESPADAIAAAEAQ
jgi:limonene-1,2-epoxide hydrolase